MFKKSLAIVIILAICAIFLVACNPARDEVDLNFKNVAYQDMQVDVQKISATFGEEAVSLDGTTLSLPAKFSADEVKNALNLTYDGQNCLVYLVENVKGRLVATVVVGAQTDTPKTINGKIGQPNGLVDGLEGTKVYINGIEMATATANHTFVIENIFGEVELTFSQPPKSGNIQPVIQRYLFTLDREVLDVKCYKNPVKTYIYQLLDTNLNVIDDITRIGTTIGTLFDFEYVDDFLPTRCKEVPMQRGYYAVRAVSDNSGEETVFESPSRQLWRIKYIGIQGTTDAVCLIMAELDSGITPASAFDVGGRVCEWSASDIGIENVDIYVNDMYYCTTNASGDFNISHIFEPVTVRFYREGYVFYAEGIGYFEELTLSSKRTGLIVRCRPSED